MEKVLRTLPALEELYNSRGEECYYQLKRDEKKGFYMVAAKDIGDAEVILVEAPLCRQRATFPKSLTQTAEAASLLATLQQCSETHGHLSGPDMYPPAARHAIDRLTELNTREYLLKSPNLSQLWELADSHRCAEVGDTVMIDGLQSESGRKLNGKQGRVVGIDVKATDRLAVETLMGASKPIKKSLKPANLKTLGGILRTNSFVDNSNSTVLLFNLLSRINHACGEYANVLKICDDDGKAFVIAKKGIRAGEELLIDYISGEAEEHRLGLLQMKYNFRCQCPLHYK